MYIIMFENECFKFGALCSLLSTLYSLIFKNFNPSFKCVWVKYIYVLDTLPPGDIKHSFFQNLPNEVLGQFYFLSGVFGLLVQLVRCRSTESLEPFVKIKLYCPFKFSNLNIIYSVIPSVRLFVHRAIRLFILSLLPCKRLCSTFAAMAFM